MRTTIVKIDGVPHKRCPACARVLPMTTEHFARASKRPGGFAGWCKRCKTARVNPEERARAARRYYKRKLRSDPDHWRTATRAWREANPERWQAVALAASRRRYARKYGNGPSDVTATAITALRTSTKKCPLCGVGLTTIPFQPTSAEVDHIIPLNVGGPHILANLRVICRACNLSRPRDGSDVEGDDIPRTPISGPRAIQRAA